MTETNSFLGKYKLEAFIGMIIVFVLSLGILVSLSIDGVAYEFDETLEIHTETSFYIDDYPVVLEVLIVADEANSENISFTLYGSGYDYGIEEDYLLIPGQSISSRSDWNIGGDITLEFQARNSSQHILISFQARTNLFSELLRGYGIQFDGLGYFLVILIPSILFSGVLFLALLIESLSKVHEADQYAPIQIITPVIFFLLLLILQISFFLPLHIVYFYFCANVFRRTILHASHERKKFSVQHLISILALILILAPFNIFFRFEEILKSFSFPSELFWFAQLVLISFMYFLTSVLIKKGLAPSFWSTVGTISLISSLFLYFLYSPFTVVIMRGQNVRNTLPIFPTNVSLIISGLILIIYGLYSSHNSLDTKE